MFGALEYMRRPVDGPRRGGLAYPWLCILININIAIDVPVLLAHRLISASRPSEMTSRVSTRPALRIRARINAFRRKDSALFPVTLLRKRLLAAF